MITYQVEIFAGKNRWEIMREPYSQNQYQTAMREYSDLTSYWRKCRFRLLRITDGVKEIIMPVDFTE